MDWLKGFLYRRCWLYFLYVIFLFIQDYLLFFPPHIQLLPQDLIF